MTDRAKSAGPGLDLDGPVAPPRTNGELVFEAPWESRVFGLTMALCQRGNFEWEEFRKLLIDEIATWEQEQPAGTPYRYYERWLAAFERLAAAKGIADPAEVDARERDYAARPAGHDHGHDPS